MTTSPWLGQTIWTEGQALPATRGNQIVSVLEFFCIGGPTLDRDLLDPTALTPAVGDAYLIDGTGAGDWLTHDDEIAIYISGWLYITPLEGMVLSLYDENIRVRYDGAAWVEVGVIDNSVFTLTTSEALTAGNFVNIHASSGAKARKANATDDTKPANAYTNTTVGSAAPVDLFAPGSILPGLSGLTPGTMYYLDTTGGAISATAPSASGNLVQEVGIALSATTLLFQPRWVVVI